MLNVLVPANAGGMPIPTPVIPGKYTDELQDMINHCDELIILGEEAEEACSSILRRGDMPEKGYIESKELSFNVSPTLGRRRISNRSEIDSIIDNSIESYRLNFEFFGNRAFDLLKRTNELNAHRARLHELFDERQKVYDDWEIASGKREAETRVALIWKEFLDIQARILEYHCADIQQLSRKAAYIAREWGGQLDQERQLAFMLEVAEFAIGKVGVA